MEPVDLLNVQVGDQILIVDRWVSGCVQNSEGRMDMYLGGILTVDEIEQQSDQYFMCRVKEDNGRWI